MSEVRMNADEDGERREEKRRERARERASERERQTMHIRWPESVSQSVSHSPTPSFTRARSATAEAVSITGPARRNKIA